VLHASGIWKFSFSTVTILPLNDGCHPESVPPVAVCRTSVSAETNTQASGIARIYASTLDNGSTDNCTAAQDLLFRLTTEDAATPPAADLLDVSGLVNAAPVYLWVGDASGNWAHCAAPLTITPAQCAPDRSRS